MATLAVDRFLDAAACTAGEAFTLNSGARLTVRTDTRWHANAPASMTGSLAAVTCNEGEYFLDGTAVRWMPYNTGAGNVPAIGTTVSQGGVSGYLLGVWASLTSAPTAVGAAMPASGFIKFREVTGGTFAAGALTGIGASATAADVRGWIEVVHDDAVDLTFPRLGKFKTRGDWFYLDNTNGSRAQVLQVPTNGGGANTYCPGVWIETSPGSNVYEQWPALNGTNNGWNVLHMGQAEGTSDERNQFVKMLSGGQMQIGETVTFASTYASVAAQASSYVDWNTTATYTLTSNVCLVFVSAGHGLYGGETVGLDFTSGTATDQNGVATVLDPYYFSVPITNANTSGNVTVRFGATVTFTAHGLGEGEQVGYTVSTGTLPAGTYTVHSVQSANVYNIAYAHTAALTSGNCSALHTLTITRASHGHAVGNRVYLDFTTGGAVDNVFTIKSTVAGSYTVNYPHSAAIASSNVTERFEIGKVPASGCKVRVPNIFARACTTGARASNTIPHATLVSRPEFITSSAGAIDIEYLYNHGWYQRFGQAYSFKMWHSTAVDTLEISECATAPDIDNVFVGHYSGGGNTALVLTSNFAGGTINNSKFYGQGTPSSSRYVLNATYCNNFTFNSCEFGHLLFARLAYGVFNLVCSGMTYNNCKSANNIGLYMATCKNMRVNDLTIYDRNIGYVGAATGAYAVYVTTGCDDVIVDGVTWFNANHPVLGALYGAQSSNLKFRNIGTSASPLPVGKPFLPNVHGMGRLFNSAGNNSNVTFQRCYLEGVRADMFATLNSDKGVVIEHVSSKEQYIHTAAVVSARFNTLLNAFLNSSVKGLGGVIQGTTGQSSVYGTHFHSIFKGSNYGLIALCMNEPTAETAAYFTMVSGTQKFNSAGGILMGVIGNQAIWETKDWILGHTGFVNTAALMSGGTIGNYTLEYQIDTGTGYSAWKTLNGTNLSGETISPSTGFKLKIRITTTSTNTTAITFLRLETTTTQSAQDSNLYPLDTVPVTITVLDSNTSAAVQNARVRIIETSGSNVVLEGVTNASGVIAGTTQYAGSSITGKVRRATVADGTLYKPSALAGTVDATSGFSTTVFLIPD